MTPVSCRLLRRIGTIRRRGEKDRRRMARVANERRGKEVLLIVDRVAMASAAIRAGRRAVQETSETAAVRRVAI